MEFLGDLVDNNGILSELVGLFIGLSHSGHLPGTVSCAEDEIKLHGSWNLSR